MEKVQQALEKARRQREGRQLDGRGAGAITMPPSMSGMVPGVGDGTDQAGSTLRTTRVEAVDQEALRAQRVVAGLNGTGTTDAFRMLRTQVMQRLVMSNASTLAITSPGIGEGKTVLAANLAITLSRFAHHTVLLVDLDLRRPNVHRVFGLKPGLGLTDYLLHDAPLPECLVNPGIDRLVILPCVSGSEMSSETLSSPRMTRLAEELKSRYPDRIVIYDLPPVLVTDDALVFLRHVEACLLVVEEGGSRKEDIERSLELLEDFNLIGTVLNKARSSVGRHGYYGYNDPRS